MSFDVLAPHYRWMELVCAGEKLQGCRTAQLAHVLAARHILILGEGNGRFLVLMRALGWEVSGVEPDPRSAAAAREQGLHPASTLADVPRPEGGFDVVTMNHVVEHFDDPVAELRRVFDRVVAHVKDIEREYGAEGVRLFGRVKW